MWLLILLAALSVGFVAIGWLGRDALLVANPCQMTLTSMQKSAVKVNSTVRGPKLYKHPSGPQLNRQPVLFVPGHRGNADQVRSMSSPIHNGDDYFQYFALDFNDADTAMHASSALTQAIFVNDALRRIQAIYAKHLAKGGSSSKGKGKGNEDGDGVNVPKIMIAGHSVGGMIARTAVTLDNHPRCAVSDIILLSAPSQRAAFSPDASMEALYRTVNRAWTQGYFNESQVCLRARAAEAVAEAVADSSVVGGVKGSWKCPACVPSIRLLSVAGGDIDILVPTKLTTLDSLLPRPRNLTMEAKAKSPAGGQSLRILSVFFDLQRSMVALALSAFRSIASLGEGLASVSSSKNSSATNDTSSDSSGSSGGADYVEKPVVRTQRDGPYGQLFAISQEDWDRDVMKYAEPQIIFLRSSQLSATGFPIDHKAILWCKQLVNAVTSGMRSLSKSDSASGEMTGLDGLMDLRRTGIEDKAPVSLNASAELSGLRFSDLIPPIAGFVRRNESSVAFRATEQDELLYFASKLPLGIPHALAVTFVSQHWICIIAAYMLVSFLVASTPLRRQLTGFLQINANKSTVNKGRSPPSEENELGHGGLDFSLLKWQAHWHAEELLCLLPSLRSAMASVLNEATMTLLSPASIVSALVAKVALDYYSSPLAFVSSTSFYAVAIRWVCSYSLALVLRLLLLTVFYGLRAIVYALQQGVVTILNYTIWSRTARRATKSGRRGLQSALDVIGLTVATQGRIWAATNVMCMAALTSGLMYLTRTRWTEGVLPLSAYLLSLTTLSFSLSSALLVLLSLLDPHSDHHATSLALLYLPVVALCYPSARFSYTLLFENSNTFAAALDLFSLFGPERLNTMLCVSGIAAHLALARSHGYSSLSHVAPLEWMLDLRRLLQGSAGGSTGASAAAGAGAKVNVSTGVGCADCLHEDGGRHAIFEEVTAKSGAKVVSPGVVLGPTYRVVGCNCRDDASLKFMSEWCEFCLCRNCGGKNLPREDGGSGDGGFGAALGSLELTPDQALLLLLVGLAFAAVWYADDRLHRHLYLLGIAAWSYLARDGCVTLCFKLNLGSGSPSEGPGRKGQQSAGGGASAAGYY